MQSCDQIENQIIFESIDLEVEDADHPDEKDEPTMLTKKSNPALIFYPPENANELI